MIGAGIYTIENRKTGRVYIGSSINIQGRIRTHFGQLQRNEHPNKFLQSSFNKHGGQNFVWDILERVEDPNELLIREQYWIDLSKNEESRLFNLSPFATGSIGMTKCLSTRYKISKTLKALGIKPPSRANMGYGFCKLYCPKNHYKTSGSLIHGSNSCKECQRLKSQQWRLAHK